MKYCPTCDTHYDEEILRFCMKDGTPLVDEEEPTFIQMPSESLEEHIEDEPDEVTIIRKNPLTPKPPPEMDENGDPLPPPVVHRSEPAPLPPPREDPQRIVVPMASENTEQQRVRSVPYQAPPPKTNVFLVVLLTMIGTTVLLGLGALGFWFLTRDTNGNLNANVNTNMPDQNINVNSNLGIDGNFDFNGFGNSDLATPSPSPSPTATASPSPTATPSPTQTPTPRPSPTPTPDDDDDDVPTPRPTPSRPPTPPPSTPAPSTPRPTLTPIIIRPGSSPTPSNRGGNN